MKNLRKLFLTCTILILSGSLHATQSAPKLIEWTKQCLERLPETNFGYKTVLQKKQFKTKIQKLATRYKKELKDNGIISKKHFIEKKEIKDSNSLVCQIGDLHGSIHALLLILLDLLRAGHIDNSFKLKNNFYLIFLGDYTDRGHYGAEVWYTLALLKLANWDKVTLLRGNHENKLMAIKDGFEEELHKKFGKTRNIFFKFLNLLGLGNYNMSWMYELFDCLPAALTVTCNNKTYQYFHGGISPEDFIGNFLTITKNFKTISSSAAYDLYWNDFSFEKKQDKFLLNDKRLSSADFNKASRILTQTNSLPPKYPLIAYKKGITNYLQKNKIDYIFRGHNHSDYVLKMFSKNHPKFTNNHGTNHWEKIVSAQEKKDKKINLHLQKYKDYPVFTLSSASGAQRCDINYNGYTILDTQNLELQIFETKLPEFKIRNNKFIKIKDVKKARNPQAQTETLALDWEPTPTKNWSFLQSLANQP